MKLYLIKLKKDWNQLEFFSSLGRLMKLFLINRWNISFSALGMSEILKLKAAVNSTTKSGYNILYLVLEGGSLSACPRGELLERDNK